MKNKILKSSLYIIIAILVGVTAVSATDLVITTLTPTVAPQKTMKSLSDLYTLVTTGEEPSTPSSIYQAPTGTPALTMTSIENIYNSLNDSLTLLTEDKLAKDEQVFGKTGTLYGDTDPSQVLDTAMYPGSATAGTPAPTFAFTDQTTYTCESLAVDPAQPAVTLQTICGYHSSDGCSWSGSACTGGTKTPADGYMTWYAATASCADKSDEDSTNWKLPTNVELYTHYMNNNQSGNAPEGFVADSYWSGTTYKYPGYESNAYFVVMNGGGADNVSKDYPCSLAHCSR